MEFRLCLVIRRYPLLCMAEMTNKKYLTGKIVPKSNRKIVETEVKMMPPPPALIYMVVEFPGLAQALPLFRCRFSFPEKTTDMPLITDKLYHIMRSTSV